MPCEDNRDFSNNQPHNLQIRNCWKVKSTSPGELFEANDGVGGGVRKVEKSEFDPSLQSSEVLKQSPDNRSSAPYVSYTWMIHSFIL